MIVIVAAYFTWRHGPSAVILGSIGVFSFAWWLLYPRWFDAQIRSHAKKQMAESSYSKSLGAYELQLLDEHLHSTSQLGSGIYTWSGVDRVAMDSDYLFIFLSGPLGYPIRIAEIGHDTAQRAHDFVAERIKLSRK